MDHRKILQIHHNRLDIEATLGIYQEAMSQWGFRDAHTQFLKELWSWSAPNPMAQSRPGQRLERAMAVEHPVLMDTGVASVAIEHLPFLYSILGEVFEDYGAGFRRMLQDEAQHIERVQEEAIHKQMSETGCNRREALAYIEHAALGRLADRRERVLAMLKAHLWMM